MKHNKKKMIHKMALAALMVSAIGAPSLVANAASPESVQKQIPMVATILDMKETLQDPVVIAKQYAPDTVRAWEGLLAQYKAALAENSQEMSVTIEAIEAQATEAFKTTMLNTDDAVELTDWKAIDLATFDANQLSAMKTTELAAYDATQLGAMKAIYLTAFDADKEMREGLKGTAVKGGIKLKVDGEELVTKVSSANDSSTLALAALDGDAKDISISLKAVMTNADTVSSPLIQGQINLSEAVEAKDSKAIKEALTKLFHIYEDMIEQMQK